MNPREAAELQKKRDKKKPCTHPSIVKEDPGPYGQWSGDYVCTQCGAMGPRTDFPKDAY
jgi:hypothetical protein